MCLNEALIVRTEDGNINFCNEIGLKLIKPISERVLKSEDKLESYFKNLRSMDYLNESSTN